MSEKHRFSSAWFSPTTAVFRFNFETDPALKSIINNTLHGSVIDKH